MIKHLITGLPDMVDYLSLNPSPTFLSFRAALTLTVLFTQLDYPKYETSRLIWKFLLPITEKRAWKSASRAFSIIHNNMKQQAALSERAFSLSLSF